MIAFRFGPPLAVARRALTSLCVVLPLIGASAPSSAQVADWDKVVAAAKAEGGLVLYTALVGAPSTKAIARAFEAKYGIPVQVLEARASELRERIRTEQSAGRYLGDVMFNSENQVLILNAEDKSIVPHEPVPDATGLVEPFRDDGLKAPVMTINYGLLVNNRLVPPGQEPKSWRDLTDPKWKGKILSDDMRAVGGGYVLFFVTQEKLGKGYNEALAIQAIQFTREQREAARRVARGEMAIYMPFILGDIQNLKGLPVRTVLPAEGAPYVLYATAAIKGAPHPNAARLYIDFSMSDEVQQIFAQDGFGVVRHGVLDKVSPEARAIADVKLMGGSDPARQNEMLDLARSIYK
ncbi:ABC transporter substrate-binding protein [Bradyrhizobium canariense]|uniref:Iron(III) transport system substrate-binding protein n=1 Tax=Bradyrhizobium canariense TaxID=255045 RepID=A0A1H2B6M3_9BRAD|nr:extracellular solute-binding protein [Bradyrhizobium canariense]SDT53722.1 iron(III) transport system substrate-binding protein [Bradyrhizobium canariense]